jgi:hypothetical protein
LLAGNGTVTAIPHQFKGFIDKTFDGHWNNSRLSWALARINTAWVASGGVGEASKNKLAVRGWRRRLSGADYLATAAIGAPTRCAPR